jgi:hypothetical protein
MTPPISPNYFKNLAIQQGKNLASVRLKDNSTVKILTGDKSLDCYVVKNGHLLEASGFKSVDEGSFLNKVSEKLEKIQKIAAEGVDVAYEWGVSLFKNASKDL